MANKVNPVNSSDSTVTNPNSVGLTTATKTELERLGVNTTNITTETQGQIALKAARQAIATQEKIQAQAKKLETPEEYLRLEAKQLALRLKLNVTTDDDIAVILSKISFAINELKTEAADKPEKSGRLQVYQAEYARIKTELNNILTRQQVIQAQITGSMSGMASYNKIYQNL